MVEAAREKEVVWEVVQEEGEERVCHYQAASPIRHRRGLSIVSSLVRRPPEMCSTSLFAVVVEVATEEAVAQEEEGRHGSAIPGNFRRRQYHN